MLEEIREIRLSERRFYQKITDIYATSVDYNKNAPTTKEFFARVQNKLHFAIHGNTAAELNSLYAQMLKKKTWAYHLGESTRGQNSKIRCNSCKNYLAKEEIESLGRIVNAYLELAEERAKRKIQ